MDAKNVTFVSAAVGTVLSLVVLYFAARVISAGWNAGKN